MPLTIPIIALGAAIGALLRYGVTLLGIKYIGDYYPYATMGVNVIGSLLAGVAYAYISQDLLSQSMRLFLMVGLLGSLTTFSSFSMELWMYVEKGALIHAFIYLFLSVTLSFGAFITGLFLTQSIMS